MRHQEINLLLVFDAIMTEGSVTRAAERLAMTQPAVSNAVSRMRSAWKDELFVKDGRNIQPTQYAQNLWNQVRTPLKELQEAVDPGQFDPSTASRSFRLAAADVAIDMVWRPLRQLIESCAPNINIYAHPYNIVNGEQLLHDAEVDLVIGGTSSESRLIVNEHLFQVNYVCIMRPEHPFATGEFTLEQFANAEHLFVSLSGDIEGIVDQVLLQYGMRRRVAMSVNHFAAVAPLLTDSNLIAVVPSTPVAKDILSGELAVRLPPIDIPTKPVMCLWHRRQEQDLGLMWLRERVNNIIRQQSARHHNELRHRFCDNVQIHTPLSPYQTQQRQVFFEDQRKRG